eukprot:TRINITY_DN10487_c0_g1_i6.p1 TRINITY_DN10487_c0_g1~~TRINITY_DN10487_c0_g1_i6.p1  ORF type:complete len:334 (+),score=71.02 TRINITY_DN10487_c0_g1_i6:3-1004(+)
MLVVLLEYPSLHFLRVPYPSPVYMSLRTTPLFQCFFFFFLMIRRPPRSTQGVSSAASDVYKRQVSTQSTWELGKKIHMGEIIKEWLNTQVELSKPVRNFEKDLSNGFLFGELLFRFSQLPDISAFQNRNTKEIKISNFMLVLPVMRNLKLKFDSNIAEKIMNEDRGVALRLLYQMKMALEKVSAPSLIKKMDEFVMSMPAQKIRPARDQYDTMTDNFFKKRLQRQIKPQKEVLMERTLQKYHDEQKRQEAIAEEEKQIMIQKETEAKAQRRKAELNKLQRNACLLYTSDAADDTPCVDLGGRRIIKKKKKKHQNRGVVRRDMYTGDGYGTRRK